jgi:hypothetical protein
MKQLTLSSFAFAVICLASCSKDPVINKQSSSPGSSMQPIQIVSNWMTMDFSWGGRENPDGFEAVHYFNPTLYDNQQETKLAFIRTNDSRRALPASILADGKELRLSFLLTFASFKVMVNSTEYTSSIGSTPLSDCQFRYLVVPNSVINANPDVDWTDYSQVATALNLVD